MRCKILSAVVFVSIHFAHAHIQEKLIIHREKINIIKNNIKLNQPMHTSDNCKVRSCKFRCKL